MNAYMIQIDLPRKMDDKFLSLVTLQRQTIDQLTEEKVILNYSLALDRKQIWITLNAPSEMDVNVILDTFPLKDYMEFHVHPLALFNQAKPALPKIGMN